MTSLACTNELIVTQKIMEIYWYWRFTLTSCKFIYKSKCYHKCDDYLYLTVSKLDSALDANFVDAERTNPKVSSAKLIQSHCWFRRHIFTIEEHKLNHHNYDKSTEGYL